jgi:tRNA A-37 threonylcarbamoyl transferase component Bud32
MNPERWQQIDQLLDVALQRNPEEWGPFLTDACTGDESLRCEVESLLAAHNQAATFIEASPPGAAEIITEWLSIAEPYHAALERPSCQRADFLAQASPDEAPRRQVQSLLDAHDQAGDFLAAPIPEIASLRSSQASDVSRRLFHRVVERFARRRRGSGSPPVKRPFFFWAVLVLTTIDLVVLGGSSWIVGRKGIVTWSSDFAAVEDQQSLVVTEVYSSGRTAGLLWPGDRIIAIDGDSRVGLRTLPLFGRNFSSGVHLTLDRHGRATDVALPPLRLPLRTPLAALTVELVPTIALLASGTYVGFLRPNIPAARLFASAALLAVPPVFTNGARVTQETDTLSEWENWFIFACHFSPLHLVISLAFVCSFPVQPSPHRYLALLVRLAMTLGLVTTVVSIALHFCSSIRPGSGIFLAWEHPSEWKMLNALVDWYPVLAFALMALIVLTKYRSTTDLQDRRRLRWMVAGTAMGILPLGLYYAAVALRTREIPGWIEAAFLFMTVPPVAVGYAVARHSLFDIRVIVRRGLQYVLARQSLGVAVGASLLVLIFEVVRNPSAQIREVPARPEVWLMLIATCSLLYARTRIVVWLDRRFFRSSYNAEQMLVSLIEEIRSQVSLLDIAHLVVERLQGAFHPETIEIFTREDRLTSFVRQAGLRENDSECSVVKSLPAESKLVRLLELNGEVAQLPAAYLSGADARPMEKKQQLVIPIGGNDHWLAGILFVGPKRSEEPYSQQDVQLLEAIATQFFIVLENASLKRRVNKERHVREEVLVRLGDRTLHLLRECPTCGKCFSGWESTCSFDGDTLTVTQPVERIIDQRWRLERRLGTGGMGTVYEATDLTLGRSVALKCMREPGISDYNSRHRFEREARVLAQLQHPNLVTLFDFGCADPGGTFLVMELVTGRTFRQILDDEKTILPSTLAAWFDQILDGVAYAHRQQIIHRDLKPENIVLSSVGDMPATPKILDFGLARFRIEASNEPVSLTKPGMVFGTLAYMSPERLLGDTADEQSDIFALGVMLVESLTGRHPFRQKDAEGTMASILHDPVHLAGNDPRIKAVDALIQRCLAKRRQDRVGTIDSLRGELVSALQSCPRLDVAPVSFHG